MQEIQQYFYKIVELSNSKNRISIYGQWRYCSHLQLLMTCVVIKFRLNKVPNVRIESKVSSRRHTT